MGAPDSQATSRSGCRRPARNQLCDCGSGRKYKRCCQEKDEAHRRATCESALPPWIHKSRAKLHQFEKYACKVLGLPELLGRLTDSRRDPRIPTFDVVNGLIHAALLRLPSINALEGDLKEPDFQKMLGSKPRRETKLFSAEVVSNVLDKLNLEGLDQALETLVFRAERNKAFREGSYGTLRCVAIDGWEPFASYHRHCDHCLVRKIKVKQCDGEIVEVDQYYHRAVVAMLLGPTMDVILAIEPVRNDEARRTAGEPAGHEGELTAAKRLIDRLHESYGRFIDAFVLDALYANGPIMTRLADHGYGGFIVLKKDGNEPLQDALVSWKGQGPCREWEDPHKNEQIACWDAPDLTTLETYRGTVRVVRAEVTSQRTGEQKTWCYGVVGKQAQKVSLRTGLRIVRSRWHIENTAFNQWIQHWNLGHVYRHTGNAVIATLLLWALVFNLLQLFVYRRLKRPRRPKDPTLTIRHIVEVMMRDLATLPEPFPWVELRGFG